MPTENEQQQQVGGESSTGSQTSSGGGKYTPATLDDATRIIQALEKRVGEREATIDELRQQSTRLAERLDAIDKAQKRRLEEDGNYAELARQREAELAALAPYKDRATALEQVIRESNEARLKRVPEDMRDLVPVDYAPERLQAWLNANESKLTRKPAPSYDAGAGAGATGNTPPSGITVTDADRRAAETASSRGFRVTAEDIAKRRAEMAGSRDRPTPQQ